MHALHLHKWRRQLESPLILQRSSYHGPNHRMMEVAQLQVMQFLEMMEPMVQTWLKLIKTMIITLEISLLCSQHLSTTSQLTLLQTLHQLGEPLSSRSTLTILLVMLNQTQQVMS